MQDEESGTKVEESLSSFEVKVKMEVKPSPPDNGLIGECFRMGPYELVSRGSADKIQKCSVLILMHRVYEKQTASL